MATFYASSRFLSSSITQTARPALRSQRQSAAQQFLRATRQPIQRRAQTTVAQEAKEGLNEGVKDAATGQSGFQKLMNSPVGPKTVHFWAPIMKWGVVLAGAADFFRPAEKLSLQQNAALVATGAIWTRWCFVIRPQNMFLAAVNFMLFCVGATQCTRVFLYRRSQDSKSLAEELKGAAQTSGEAIKGVVENPQKAFKKAEESAK